MSKTDIVVRRYNTAKYVKLKRVLGRGGGGATQCEVNPDITVSYLVCSFFDCFFILCIFNKWTDNLSLTLYMFFFFFLIHQNI